MHLIYLYSTGAYRMRLSNFFLKNNSKLCQTSCCRFNNIKLLENNFYLAVKLEMANRIFKEGKKLQPFPSPLTKHISRPTKHQRINLKRCKYINKKISQWKVHGSFTKVTTSYLNYLKELGLLKGVFFVCLLGVFYSNSSGSFSMVLTLWSYFCYIFFEADWSEWGTAIPIQWCYM